MHFRIEIVGVPTPSIYGEGCRLFADYQCEVKEVIYTLGENIGRRSRQSYLHNSRYEKREIWYLQYIETGNYTDNVYDGLGSWNAYLERASAEIKIGLLYQQFQ